MKKVGLMTIYSVPNFGSVLQTYATQVLLERLGVECWIIDYDRSNSWYYSHGSFKPSLVNSVVKSLGIKSKHRKEKKLNNFRNRYLHLTSRYKSLYSLETASWTSYDAFVVGSDQVWNTRFSYGDSVYLLSFVPNGKPKISIASSFALKELPDKYIDKFRYYLSSFEHLSVREAFGKDIIQKQLLIDKDVEILIDPTLLLSQIDWLEAIPRSHFKKKEKYILLYMLDYAFRPQPYIFEVASYFQKKYGYNIYVLEGEISKEYKSILKYKDVIDSSIPEFIDYFSNADIVITSSFHGSAFALNFGRPLISIVPGGGDDRQTSILKDVCLSKLAVKVGDDIQKISPAYDYDKEQQLLKKLRDKSVKWIEQALSEI